jgi:hypothetical protein
MRNLIIIAGLILILFIYISNRTYKKKFFDALGDININKDKLDEEVKKIRDKWLSQQVDYGVEYQQKVNERVDKVKKNKNKYDTASAVFAAGSVAPPPYNFINIGLSVGIKALGDAQTKKQLNKPL